MLRKDRSNTEFSRVDRLTILDKVLQNIDRGMIGIWIHLDSDTQFTL